MFISGHKLNQIVFWVMGALWNASWNDVIIIIPFLLIGTGVIYAYARDLNIMLLGEEDASHLGTDVSRVKTILLVASALLAAAAVSVSGIIGFVGLIIPHIMRLILGPDHRLLIPASLPRRRDVPSRWPIRSPAWSCSRPRCPWASSPR